MQEWNRLVKPFKFAQFAHRQVPSDGNWDLHVFIDGSKNGYAAIVYATVKVENTKYSSIMYAKSRLMPIKLITMPKAELLAAEVGAKIIKFVRKQLNLDKTILTA